MKRLTYLSRSTTLLLSTLIGSAGCGADGAELDIATLEESLVSSDFSPKRRTSPFIGRRLGLGSSILPTEVLPSTNSSA